MIGKSGRQNELKKQLRRLCPHMALADFNAVIEIASAGHLRHLPPAIALWQGLSSHIRHVHTDYDVLLAEGYDRDSARFFVVDTMNAVLDRWGCTRRIMSEDE
jgi:hypothetical protein